MQPLLLFQRTKNSVEQYAPPKHWRNDTELCGVQATKKGLKSIIRSLDMAVMHQKVNLQVVKKQKEDVYRRQLSKEHRSKAKPSGQFFSSVSIDKIRE